MRALILLSIVFSLKAQAQVITGVDHHANITKIAQSIKAESSEEYFANLKKSLATIGYQLEVKAPVSKEDGAFKALNNAEQPAIEFHYKTTQEGKICPEKYKSESQCIKIRMNQVESQIRGLKKESFNEESMTDTKMELADKKNQWSKVWSNNAEKYTDLAPCWGDVEQRCAKIEPDYYKNCLLRNKTVLAKACQEALGLLPNATEPVKGKTTPPATTTK